ncbi:MAG: alpha/beta hydrolase [Actinomycetota bacterium]
MRRKPALLVLALALALAVPVVSRAAGSEIRRISFWSAALQKTVNVTVILPPNYGPASETYPVVYLLHGSANETQNEFGPAMIEGLTDDLAAHGIVGVLPDSGSGWTDARDPQPKQIRWEATWPQENEPILGVNRGSATVDDTRYTAGQQSYERHLLTELLPYIESHFAVSRDRRGRGVFGHSGGAYGSFILATRHPDLFSFLGGSSGPISWRDEAWFAVGAAIDLAWGGRDPITDEVFMRSRDPKELAENLLGTGMTIMHSSGCADPATQFGDPTCGLEGFARPINDDWDAHATEIGLPHTYFRLDGPDQRTHAVPFVALPVYEQYFVPAAAATFANPPAIPTAWRYKTADRDFRLWDWAFHVDRPNREFLTLLNVMPGGFVARGTGSLVVETPPTYQAGGVYQITATGPAGVERSTARAGEDRRLRFTVQLGAPRLIDQQSALEQAGAFPFDEFSVAIGQTDTPSDTPAPECPPAWIYPVIRCGS